MKRTLALLLFALGLILLLAVTASAEGETATFYVENRVHLTLDLENNTVTLPVGPNLTTDTQKFVGWALTAGESEVLYPVGATVTLPDGMTEMVFRAIIIEFKTLSGAAVSMGSPTTLRFDGAIAKADYDRLVSLVGKDNIQIGMLVAPTNSIYGAETDSTKFSLTAEAEGLLNRTVDRFFYSTEQYHVFSGRTDAIADDQLLTLYSGRAYLTLDLGERSITVYATYVAENHDRMAHYVTAKAYEDRVTLADRGEDGEALVVTCYSNTALEMLKDRLDKVVSVSQMEGGMVVSEYSMTPYGPFEKFRYYTSPYTVGDVLLDDPVGYDTYVIVAMEGADIQNVATYYIGHSYRPPKAEEWKEDGLYISVRNNTGLPV